MNENASDSFINKYLVEHHEDYIPRHWALGRVLPERMVAKNHHKGPRLLNALSTKYSMALPLLNPHSRVLDLCAGAGLGSQILVRSKHSVVAVDINPDLLEFRKGIEIFKYNLIKEELPWKDTFDAVYLIDAIEHFDAATQVSIMEKIWKVLKFNGLLVIDTPLTRTSGWKSEHHIHELSWGDFGTLVSKKFSVERRFRIQWAGDMFSVLIEDSEEEKFGKHNDQIILARKPCLI